MKVSIEVKVSMEPGRKLLRTPTPHLVQSKNEKGDSRVLRIKHRKNLDDSVNGE